MDTGGKLSIAMRISGVDFAQTSILVPICNGPANGICFGEVGQQVIVQLILQD